MRAEPPVLVITWLWRTTGHCGHGTSAPGAVREDSASGFSITGHKHPSSISPLLSSASVTPCSADPQHSSDPQLNVIHYPLYPRPRPAPAHTSRGRAKYSCSVLIARIVAIKEIADSREARLMSESGDGGDCGPGVRTSAASLLHCCTSPWMTWAQSK